MFYLYTGTDREKVRSDMREAIARLAKGGARVIRITDTNTLSDLRAVLGGAGMFLERRIVVLEHALENDEMKETMLSSLAHLKKSPETFFIVEEKPDAATRRLLEKHAETSTRLDLSKQEKATTVFSLAHALKRADKKALWVGLEREFAHGASPEAIHGVLFWGAKDLFLTSREGSAERQRARKLVAALAELPHEARRNNMPLDFALERFALSA